MAGAALKDLSMGTAGDAVRVAVDGGFVQARVALFGGTAGGPPWMNVSGLDVATLVRDMVGGRLWS
jgi:hypothetical protein